MRTIATAVAAAAIALVGLATPAQASQENPNAWSMRVHAERGDWAYRTGAPDAVVTVRGTNAAYKMRHADIGGGYYFRDALVGTYEVTDILKGTAPAHGADYDLSLHIKGTDYYVLLGEVVCPSGVLETLPCSEA